jgi:drebrin-like protein
MAAAEENELSFAEGETLTVTEKIDENWWRGTNAAGQSGMFPAAYVREL